MGKTSNKKTIITGIPAGFPIPSSDFTQSLLDLNDLVVEHAAATYFVRVQGHSMKNVGIFTGDILVVDRALEAKNGSVVVAEVDGEFTVKKMSTIQGKRYLVAENSDYKPIELKEGMKVEIWGVVTFVIHQLSVVPLSKNMPQ